MRANHGTARKLIEFNGKERREIHKQTEKQFFMKYIRAHKPSSKHTHTHTYNHAQPQL